MCALASWAGPAGSGLPNLSWPGKQPFEMLARVDASVGAPRGHGFVTMHGGYFMVVFSNDGGGGGSSGGFAFLDLSDPENPATIFTTNGTAPYNDPGSPQFAGRVREAHGYSFSGDLWCMTTNGGGASGLQFWDLANPTAPNKLSELNLSSLTGGDYSPTAWWVCWQGGRYAYVASTTGGLHIVDASDPANPVELKRIPIGSLGGFRVNTCFAIGNLLVIAQSDGGGIATFDISDPATPALLDVDSGAEVGYSMMVNGNRILGAHDPARVYDISDPSNIALEATGPNVAGKGGYGTFKDGQFYYGSSSAIVRLDISSQPYASLGTASPPGFSGPDWDFAVALGNLIFAGNDHDGSALLVGDTSPDLTAPEVNMVSPVPGAVNVALTSRVGITLTDQVQTATIGSSSFIVRPQGGTALAGRYSNQTGIVNFWPDAPLTPNTTYEVVVPAGGIEDFARNGVGTAFVSQFSTGSTITNLSVDAGSPGPHEVGSAVSFTAAAVNADSPEFSWDFGDGTPATAFSASPDEAHTYVAPGNYQVLVRMRDGSSMVTKSFAQVIHRPLSASPPAASSTIVFDAPNNRVWNTNPDNDTVTAIDATTFAKQLEIPVGAHPRNLALGPGNELWVTCQEDDHLARIDRTSGAVLGSIDLAYGDAPFAVVFSPDQSAAYLTLEGPGRLVRLDPATRAVTGTLDLGDAPRAIAVTADGARILVTRFISPDARGEVIEIDAASFTVTRTIGLQVDPGPDEEDSGRGLPNYLGGIAISPDGTGAWIASKKDNIQRGLARDGLPLTFESTVRSIVSKIDLASGLEDLSARVDFNDRDLASAVAFSQLGNYVFVATQGTQTIEIVDAYSNAHFGSVLTDGFSPQGIAVSADGSRLFVHSFLSRAVTVFAIENLCAGTCGIAPRLERVAVVSTELLPPQVLDGKRVFYNAADLRMSRDSYLSCASCHLDGESDGRTWDFTDRGEGLRNTPSLDGRGGPGHGRVHWSANFDEIQDFEHDIRGPFGGSGFMSDADFFSGNRDRPLGAPKAGESAELDALAAYLGSLTSVPRSPFREADGAMTPSAQQGEVLFAQRCATCHSGPDFTDSVFGVLHDVGTLSATSGQRLGKTLPGIDAPGLRGAWATAPYLHDGSAATFLDVLTAKNPGDRHGVTSDLSPGELQNLTDYLLQLDDSNADFPVVAPPPEPDSDGDGLPNTYEDAHGLDAHFADAAADSDDDGSSNLDEFNRGTDPGNPDTDGDGLADGLESDSGTYGGPGDPGTDPLDPDSDADGFPDGEEVAGGSNPLDGSSTPGPGKIITGVSETSGQPEGVTATFLTGVSFGEDVDAFTDRDHEWNGVNASGLPAILVAQDYVQTANDSRGTANYTLTVTLGRTGHLYLLLDNRVSPPAWMTDGAGLDFADTGLDVGWDENGNGAGPGNSIDQTASVYLARDTANGDSANLPPGSYTLYERGGSGNSMYGVVAVPADADNDGMPDDFELANRLNPNLADAHLDADGDGSSNLQEYQRGTGVNDPDSDDDGLLDGVERGSGTFVSAGDTGTNPLNRDSDSDGFGDFSEVRVGTDPNDGGSVPGFVPLEVLDLRLFANRVELTVDGLDVVRTYRLRRSRDLVLWEDLLTGFVPPGATATLTDSEPPASRGFYIVEDE